MPMSCWEAVLCWGVGGGREWGKGVEGGGIPSPVRPHLTFHPKPKQQLCDCREPGLSHGLLFDF